jgi:serine protease AprX
VPVSLGAPIPLKRAVALLFLLCVALPGLPAAGAAPAEHLVSVIVQGFSPAAIDDAVESVGGTIEQQLPIVGGAEARVPSSSIPTLESKPGIIHVSNDGKIEFLGGPSTLDSKRIQKVVNSDDLWNEGIKGNGVTVAVLDTGIYAGHPDLAGRVIHCEDLSQERNTAGHCADTYGHGTFMAGLIAGNGSSSQGKYKGAAPEANLVAIKVAGYDGSTDVSNILAGIQWAVSFKDTYDIGVLNLSLGTNSSQDYRVSPLNHAVERAWNAGIAVVVSSGNTGPDGRTIMKPGDDPFVITVGASSDMGTSTITDDVVAGFSGRGPTRANGLTKPDIVSPGVHTISLRSPGSAVDSKYPDSRVDGMYFRGSGTSMATATVSGVVAQMLQAHPSLSPNQLKKRLTHTARPLTGSGPNDAGSGLIDAYGSVRADVPGSSNLDLLASTGLGSLELDRGTLHLDVQTGIGPLLLQGEFVAQTDPSQIDLTNPAGLVPWNGSNWSGSNWSGSNWSGSNWSGSNWSGSNWSGSNWSATAWTGSNWSGSNWSNVTWDASNWSGSNWSEADWNASNWSGSNWSGSNWSGSNWSGAWYAVAWD